MKNVRLWLAASVLACASATASAIEVPVVYDKLPNGLKIVISEAHAAPTVTVAVYYGIGFRVEPKGQTGFAHLFEHMMFQGSEHVKKMEHAKLVEANGGNLNGSTRLDYTNYFETLPSDRVETALWLEADRMRSLDISDENLKNQQNVVSEEVRVNVLNQPYALFEWLDLWQNANQNWFNAHNFYGDLHDIEAAKIDDVRQFFKTYYAPNNAVLAIVGDVDPVAVRKLVDKHFASIPRQTIPQRPDVSEPPQTKEKSVRQPDKLANVPAFAIGWHMPDQHSADYAPAVLLNLILQGDDGSRFYQRLVKDKQISIDWTGGINFALGNEFDFDGPMLLVSRTTYKPDHNAGQILHEVDAVVRDLQEKGPTAREVTDAKIRFRSNFYDALETTEGKANLLAAFALFRDDPSLINNVLPVFDTVTAAQIQSVAKKYLTSENRTTIDRVPAKEEK